MINSKNQFGDISYFQARQHMMMEEYIFKARILDPSWTKKDFMEILLKRIMETPYGLESNCIHIFKEIDRGIHLDMYNQEAIKELHNLLLNKGGIKYV